MVVSLPALVKTEEYRTLPDQMGWTVDFMDAYKTRFIALLRQERRESEEKGLWELMDLGDMAFGPRLETGKAAAKAIESAI